MLLLVKKQNAKHQANVTLLLATNLVVQIKNTVPMKKWKKIAARRNKRKRINIIIIQTREIFAGFLFAAYERNFLSVFNIITVNIPYWDLE